MSGPYAWVFWGPPALMKTPPTTYYGDMISSTALRRALLILAVTSFLISRASAQTTGESDFHSELGRIKALLAQAENSKATPQKPVAEAPQQPKADDAVWAKVLETVKNDGTYTPENGPMPARFEITDSTGDTDGVYEAHTIMIAGTINEQEQFEAMGAMILSTVRTQNQDGTWRIEQWMFQTNIYGEVEMAGGGIIIQSPDGKTISQTPLRLAPTDPRIQTKYDAMLKHWAERTPKGA